MKPNSSLFVPSLDRRCLLQGAGAGLLLGAMGVPVRAQEPNRGGTFRIGMAHGETADTLDPHVRNNGFLQDLCYGMYNCLTEIGADGALVPELAESWESSPDAKVWTFKLRQGVEFHNGKPLDSADVAASINYHRGEGSKSEAKVLVDQIESVATPDDTQIVITLSAGNADFPFLLADHHLIICPASGDGIDWQSGIGTGPYVMQRFEPGQVCEATRNPNYWKEGRAHFDAVRWMTILDAAARQNALLTGEVDAIDQVPVTTLDRLSQQDGIAILDVAGMLHYTFPMLTNASPFDDNNVRMALKLAVNRQQLLDVVLGGHGTLGNDHPIPRNHRYYADLPQREQDLDKAKWYLGQAGLTDLKVELHAAESVFPGAVDAVTLISEQGRGAGIDITVVREPNDAYWSTVWQKKPWCVSYWGGRATEDWMLSSAYLSTASGNETAFNNPRFDQIVIEARTELDEDRRKALYVEAQTLLMDEGGALIPMFANHLHGLAANVSHPEQVGGNWQFDGHRAVERWWFA